MTSMETTFTPPSIPREVVELPGYSTGELLGGAVGGALALGAAELLRRGNGVAAVSFALGAVLMGKLLYSAGKNQKQGVHYRYQT